MRHNVVDVGILLDRHEFVDPHAAESADAAQVISFEIDEHEVLRPFFFICKQFTNEALIVARVMRKHPPTLADGMRLARERVIGEESLLMLEYIRA